MSEKNLWIALLFFFLSCVDCYAPVTKYSLYDDDSGGHGGDSQFYVQMAQGTPLEQVQRPYRYRILTPYLASLVPFLPDAIAKHYVIDPQKVIKFKFAVVNALLLWVAGMAFFAWLTGWGLRFGNQQALLAVLLFYGSFQVVVHSGTVLVEAGAYAGLTVGLWAAFNVPWAFGPVFLAALLFKETAVLLLPAVWLVLPRWEAVKRLAAALPGLLFYFWFRLVWSPDPAGLAYVEPNPLAGFAGLLQPGHLLYVGIELILCAGPLWALAVVGYRALPEGYALRRMAPLVALPLLIPFVMHTVLGRVFFLAFPVILPLAAVGITSQLISIDKSSSGK